MTNEASRRIVVIGPVLPFRGGIAQHTTMLKRALAETSDLLTISFSRQYPSLIFPGESDRDPTYEGHTESQTEYMIDSLNPLSWVQAVRRIIDYKAKTVVIPWWTVFWAPCFSYIARKLKRKGLDVVFLCHNVVEHEAATWKSVLTKAVLKNASRFVVHTREDEKNLKVLLPKAPVSIHPHPIYDQFPPPKEALTKRKSLELLFFGFVRPYKGLEDLMEAMDLLKGEDIQLTIAGEFWNGEKETLAFIENRGLTDQIEVCPRYHTDEETAELFARADVVVLPYKSATGSGVVPIAYHYNKPVIVTKVGGLPDVVKDKLTGFIVPPQNVAVLAQTIKRLDRDSLKVMESEINNFKKDLSWGSLASEIVGTHV